MFRGLRRTVLAILTLALILTFPVTASATDAGFSDVPETAPYHDSVVYLSERQIVTGTGVGQFSPDAPITVRQWAVMLCRAYGVQMNCFEEYPSKNIAAAIAGRMRQWMDGAESERRGCCLRQRLAE